MKDETVTIKKTQLDFLLKAMSSNVELESELVAYFDSREKEQEFKSSFSSLSKLENTLQIQVDYKSKMKYSSKREEEYLELIRQVRNECKIYQHNSYLYACIVKSKNRMLVKLCEDLINTLDLKTTKLGDFILRAITRLQLFSNINDQRNG